MAVAGARLFIAGRAIASHLRPSGQPPAHRLGMRLHAQCHVVDHGWRCVFAKSAGAVLEEMRQGGDQGEESLVSGGVRFSATFPRRLQFSCREVEGPWRRRAPVGRYSLCPMPIRTQASRARRCRRAHHRERQPHGRTLREADGGEGHVLVAQSSSLIIEMRKHARRIRHEFGHAGQEHSSSRAAPESLDLQAPRQPGPYGTDLLGQLLGRAVEGIHGCARVLSSADTSSERTTIGARSGAWRQTRLPEPCAFADLLVREPIPLKT